MSQSDVFESFQKYFSVEPAVSLCDRQKTYRIRYRVYCEEFAYEPSRHFPGGMEMDEFDGVAVHSLITHVATGIAAGSVRICPASVDGTDHILPFERCCASSLSSEALASIKAPRTQICEASRFAVDCAFRRRSGETATRFGDVESLDPTGAERRTFPMISMALLLACSAVSQILGRPYMFAVMEPFLPRLLKRTGIVFRRMGDDINYHGIRAVYLANTEEFASHVSKEFEPLYRSIYRALSSGLNARP